MRSAGSKLAATEDIIDQPEAQNSRDQVADDAKGRKTEKQGFHPGGDNHRGGHYQGSDDDAQGETIGNVLQGATNSTQVFVLKADEIQMTLFRSKCEELNKHTQSYVTQFLHLATWFTLNGTRPFMSWYLAR